MSEFIQYPKPSGATYSIPDVGENNWGQNVTDFLVAIPNGTVPTSGTFTLTGDLNWGAVGSHILKDVTSTTTNAAGQGFVRLAKTDVVAWRNNANSGNLQLAINGSDQLTFNGTVLQTVLTLGNLTDAGTDGIVVTNGTGAVVGSGTSLAQHVADTTHNGYLSSTDWNTFNGKGSGTVTSVSGTSNQITSTGGTTPVLAIASPLTTPGALTATGDISAGVHTLIAGAASIGGSGVTGSVILLNSVPHSITVTIPAGIFTDYSLILPNSVGSTGQVLTAAVSGSSNTLGWSTPAPTNAAVQSTITSPTSTSSTSFVDAGISASITPSSSSRRVKISLSGYLSVNGLVGGVGYLTLVRTSTNLGATNGMSANSVDVTSTTTVFNPSIVFIDSPSTSSSVTYKAQIKADAGTSTVIFGNANVTSTLILEEII